MKALVENLNPMEEWIALWYIYSIAEGSRVMDIEKEVKALRRDVDKLISLAETMTERHALILKRQREDVELLSKGINQLLGDSRQLFKNDRFVFEMLYPVFHKMFPDDMKYQAEFERIVGKEVGPEESRKRP